MTSPIRTCFRVLYDRNEEFLRVFPLFRRLVPLSTIFTMRLLTACLTAVAALMAQDVGAFMVVPSSAATPRTTTLLRADTWDGASSGAGGSMEQIEFKIHADGRVEETVRGVKGNNCHKVTEKINKQLGKVVASSPTEEMFEEEVKVQQTIYQSESDWEGSSSW